MQLSAIRTVQSIVPCPQANWLFTPFSWWHPIWLIVHCAWWYLPLRVILRSGHYCPFFSLRVSNKVLTGIKIGKAHASKLERHGSEIPDSFVHVSLFVMPNTATMFACNLREYTHLHVLRLGFLANGSLPALRIKLHWKAYGNPKHLQFLLLSSVWGQTKRTAIHLKGNLHMGKNESPMQLLFLNKSVGACGKEHKQPKETSILGCLLPSQTVSFPFALSIFLC